MRLQIHEPPLAIEQLVFQVEPEHLDRWLELDHQIWTVGLAQWTGFVGKETWINQDKPGEITAIIYWTSLECWKSIDPEWVARTDEAFKQAVGNVDWKLVRTSHRNEQFFKISESTKPD